VVSEHNVDIKTKKLDANDIEDMDVRVEREAIVFEEFTKLGVSYQGKLIAGFHIPPNTVLDQKHDKVKAVQVKQEPKLEELHMVVKAEHLEGGGGGFNVSKLLSWLGIPAVYIALHPKGTIKPEFPGGLEVRLIEVEVENATPMLNLVIPKVKRNEEYVVSDRRIIKHPRNDMDYNGEIELEPGLVLIDSVGYEGLVKSVLRAYNKLKSSGKQITGMAALTEKMAGDIAYDIISNGFTLVMNEREVCTHANNLSNSLNLEPFHSDEVNYAALFVGVYYLRELMKLTSGQYQPIFVTLGKQGSMVVDAQGNVYIAGILRPEQEPENTLGAGDAYTTGVAVCEFAEKCYGRGYGMEDVMRFATAIARAKIDERLELSYVSELLSEKLQFAMLPKPIEHYARKVIFKQGAKDVNNEVELALKHSSGKLNYYIPTSKVMVKC